MWTQFWDMSSGGSQKEDFHYCYIEAAEDEAKAIFYNRFGHNPERVTCTCCGEDYSISESETLEDLTGYHRGCKNVKDEDSNEGWKYIEEHCGESYRPYILLQDYVKQDDVLVISSDDIKDEERTGEVPQ